jgi:hypothetical protein
MKKLIKYLISFIVPILTMLIFDIIFFNEVDIFRTVFSGVLIFIILMFVTKSEIFKPKN